jgi:hypothetical protein
LTFKAAYVRQTIDHEVIASSVFGFAALALLPIFFKYEINKVTRWAAGIAVSIMLLVALPISLPLELPLLTRYPALVAYNFMEVGFRTGPGIAYLGGSKAFAEKHANRMQKIVDENKLPVIAGPVDIFPVFSNVAIAHGFDYRPRPVFQSYLAYRQPLTETNEKHLLSDKAAPTIIVQDLKDYYGYYPTLYDGPSWPTLLTHYEPVSCQPAGLVLKKRTTDLKSELKVISAKKFQLGKTVTLDPSENQIIFVKIDANLTPLGSLQKLFYRIFPPSIDVVLKDGSKKHYIAPSDIMKSGFILSPFVVRTDETRQLYDVKRDGLRNNEVASVTISETKNELPWNVFSPECSIETFELSITDDTK